MPLIKANPLRKEKQVAKKPVNPVRAAINNVQVTAQETQKANAGAFKQIQKAATAQGDVAARMQDNATLFQQKTNQLINTETLARGKAATDLTDSFAAVQSAQAAEADVRSLNPIQVIGRIFSGGELGVEKHARATLAARRNFQDTQQLETSRRAGFTTRLNAMKSGFGAQKNVTDAQMKRLDSMIKLGQTQVKAYNTNLDNTVKVMNTMMQAARFEAEEKTRVLEGKTPDELSLLAAEAQQNGSAAIGGFEYTAGRIRDMEVAKRKSEGDLVNVQIAIAAGNEAARKNNESIYIGNLSIPGLKDAIANNGVIQSGVDAEGKPTFVQLPPTQLEDQLLKRTESVSAQVEAEVKLPGFSEVSVNYQALVQDMSAATLKLGKDVPQGLANKMRDLNQLSTEFNAVTQSRQEQAANSGLPVDVIPFDSKEMAAMGNALGTLRNDFDKEIDKLVKGSGDKIAQRITEGWLRGGIVTPIDAITFIGANAFGGNNSLNVTDPIHRQFLDSFERAAFELAQQEQIVGKNQDFSSMDEKTLSLTMNSIFAKLFNSGKDMSVRSQAQLTMLVRKAASASSVNRQESFYGSLFNGDGKTTGLSASQIAQSFEFAREEIKKFKKEETAGQKGDLLDAQLTLQALRQFNIGGVSGDVLFMKSLHESAAQDKLAEMERKMSEGSRIDYAIGQAGVQKSLSQEIARQNQFFAVAQSRIELRDTQNTNKLMSTLADPMSFRTGIGLLAAKKAGLPPEEFKRYEDLIKANPNLDWTVIEKRLKDFAKEKEDTRSVWESMAAEFSKFYTAASDQQAQEAMFFLLSDHRGIDTESFNAESERLKRGER